MTTSDLIESFFPSSPYRAGFPLADCNLRVDISESDKAYVIKADVPGTEKEGLHVEFHDGVLTISASAKSESEKESGEGGERVIHRERYAGRFERSFRFGKEIDSDSVKAKLDDGVLTVTVSKRDPEVARKERAVTIE